MLRAHERRAIAESPADALAVKLAVLLDLKGKVRHRQRRPADADEGNSAVADVRRAGLREKFLQVAVTAADHRQLRKRLLKLPRQTEVAVHTQQWMLRRLVGIGRR